MIAALVSVFIGAYAAIALEHPLKINKSASALICAALMWTIYSLSIDNPHLVGEKLSESLVGSAQIVFFLMGAMTIVEVVDAHSGFEVFTKRIRTASLSALTWQVGFLTFFMSAILDNITTTIVMISLIRKLLAKRDDRLLLAGVIVIAANSGGAWSPIGDVTTTMLWIGGQITTLAIVRDLFLPSLISMAVPLCITAYGFRGREVTCPERAVSSHYLHSTEFERSLMLFLGLAILAAVPAFKAITHLPPFMGILFGLGILWLIGDFVHRSKDDELKKHFTLAHALSRIDMSSLVFFIGILLSVSVLEHTHILTHLAQWMSQSIGRQDIIVVTIGIISAIVDNVPLVAALMGMYSLTDFPPDHFLWKFLTYCAGTGGSILVIGSAAGVAAMGLEKVNFIWYLKRISGLAMIGYFAGAGAFLLQQRFVN